MWQTLATTEVKILVSVATKQGHAAFWVHDVLDIRDTEGGAQINLTPHSDGDRRFIQSSWSTDRIMRAIQDAQKGAA
jgi:hypothetical protein